MPVVEKKLLLTVAEAARLLGIGRDKLYDIINRGDLESVMIDHRRRIPRDAIDTYVCRLRESA